MAMYITQMLNALIGRSLKHVLSLLLLTFTLSAYAQFDMEAEPWRKGINVRNAVDINSPNSEFSPTYYQDGIVFASDQKQHGPIDKHTGERYLELYYAPLDMNGDPLKPKEFSIRLNSRLHEAATTFNNAQDRIIFTRNSQKAGKALANKKHIVQMRLYEAAMGKLDWENVEELEFNGENFSCMHPTLSPSGDKLYFASDMPGEGARGDMDIYVVEWEDGRWGRPRNLGPKVNTPAKEAFPFIHDSGVLFFASQGHNGVGGFDIYMLNLGDEEEEVVNLGKPFNTVKDDFGFILSRDGLSGFFSSDRSGGMGRDDIYRFDAPEGIKSMRKTFKLNSIVEVTDMDSDKPILSASVRVLEYVNGELEEDIYDYTFTPKPNSGGWNQDKTLKEQSEIRKDKKSTNHYGEVAHEFVAEKEYLLLLTKPGYQPVEFPYSTIGKLEPERIRIKMQEQNCFDLLGTVRTQDYASLAFSSITITNECTGEERTITSNVSGKFIYCLEPGCKFKIVSNLEGYLPSETSISTVKIRGSRSLNVEMQMKLDPDYYIEEEVIASAPQPIDRMSNSGGRENDGGISENYSEDTGEFTNSEAAVGSEGTYFDEPIEEGNVIILENIYYELGAHRVADDAARELDELARIMLYYPSMTIRMVAYTDVQGKYTDNLDLSDRRASAAKRYLLEQGIDARRIDAIGLGESSPRNHCKNGIKCTDKQHAYNRRTEVHIRKVDKSVEFRRRDILQSRRP